MKTCVHLWYVAEFFVELEMFQAKVVEIKHIFSSVIFLRKLCRLWDNVETCCIAGETTGDDMTWHMPFAYRITKARNSHSEYVIVLAFPL